MKILIDIGHPAHVHLFKHFAWNMQKNGHIIQFTCRDKEHEIYLLNKYNFIYTSFGKHYSSRFGKVFGLFKFNVQMFFVCIRFNPAILLSHGSIYAAQIAWLTCIPHISLEDSGNMEQIRLYRPFTKAILVPNILPERLGKKEIRYNSFHEIAYLHPNYYQPDINFRKIFGLDKEEKYVIMRFVSWTATHDQGHKGLSYNDKSFLVSLFEENNYKVFISSESKLPLEFEKYRVSFSPEMIHDALYYASLFIGEGATMASEAGLLGTTAIYVNSIARSYCKEQEKYGLVFNYLKSEPAIVMCQELLKTNLKKKTQERNHILSDKIDLTAFLVWFIENYPESFRIMKETPDYQNRFKMPINQQNP